MKALEKNSKKTFLVALIIYLVVKINNAINILNTDLKDIPELGEEFQDIGQSGKAWVMGVAIISTILFILITYNICKWIFYRINEANVNMLDRFSNIYFANGTILYLLAAVLGLLSPYMPESLWLQFGIKGVIKILIAIGINLLILDREEDSEIRLAPNIVLFAVLFSL